MIAAAQPEVGFRLAGGVQPLILLPVSVNGSPAREFILDTGAGTTLLSPDLARELDIEITGSKEGQTAGGKVKAQLGRVASIEVGNVCCSDVDVAITDLTHLGRAVGAQIHGNLGYNFLKSFRITIDFARKHLRFDEPRRIDYFGPAPLAELPIRLAHPSKPLILVDAHIDERGPFVFAIDTGTSTSAISLELTQELNLGTSSVSPVTTGSTAIEVSAARLSSLRLAGARQADVDVISGNFLAMLSKAIGTNLDGILGYNFLRHYKVVIDYPGATLSLFTP